MKYYISNRLNIEEKRIEIDKGRIDILETAYCDISQSIFLEEKFDILLENYSEYEKDLLTIAWDSILYLNYDLLNSVNVRDLITRKIINLLGTLYIFKSQWKKHLRAMSWITPIEIKKIEDLEKRVKNELLGFRFCCKLRNYATHNDLPVSLYKTSLNVDEKLNDKPYLRSAVIPCIELEDLIKDKEMMKFKKEFMEKTDKDIDLRPLIRESILGLAKMNNHIRETLEEHLLRCESLLFNSAKDISSGIPSELEKIYLIHLDDTTDQFFYKTIDFRFIARRKAYIEKNNISDPILKYYATNKL